MEFLDIIFEFLLISRTYFLHFISEHRHIQTVRSESVRIAKFVQMAYCSCLTRLQKLNINSFEQSELLVTGIS